MKVVEAVALNANFNFCHVTKKMITLPDFKKDLVVLSCNETLAEI